MGKVLEREKQIVALCKEDKNASFGELYRMYYKDVYRYLRSITQNSELAEDLLQETFILAFHKIDRFEWKDISLKHWLLSIARKKSYGKLRRKKYEFPIAEEYIETNMSKDIDIEINALLLNTVEGLLSSLHVVEREIVILKVWEEISFQEISKLLDRSESSIKMTYYRAIEKIKSLVESENKKEYKGFTAYPTLAAAIFKVGSMDIYSPGQHLSNFTLPGTMTLITSVSAYIANVGVAKVAAILVPVVATVGLTGAIIADNPTDAVQENNTNSVVTEQKTEEKKEEATSPTEGEVSIQPVDDEISIQPIDGEIGIQPIIITPPVEEPVDPPITVPAFMMFEGKYVKAEVPFGFGFEELTVGQYYGTGFIGFRVTNVYGVEIFSLEAAEAYGGGSSLCDIKEFTQFNDENPSTHGDLQQQIRDACGNPGFVLPINTINTGYEFNILGQRVRSSGNLFYKDAVAGDGYFSIPQIADITMNANGGLCWGDSTNPCLDNTYYMNFAPNMSQGEVVYLVQLLQSVTPR